MATFVGTVSERQIRLIVWVSVSGEPAVNHREFWALADTGAQTMMISENVVQGTGLHAIGFMQMIPATGDPTRISRYRVRLDIPIASPVALPGGRVGQEHVLRGMDLEVGKLPYIPDSHDVLLGMDFLSAFHITMYGGNYILSN